MRTERYYNLFPKRIVNNMLKTLEAPELVFGLCSAVGTKNSKFVKMIERQLTRFKYNSEYFKVTDLMKELEIQGQDLDDSSTNSRYDTYIKYANKLREKTQHNNILAILSTRAISKFRENQGKEFIPRQAYIFDQYKRPEEIILLRQTYSQLFILVSLYSSKEKRVKYLSQRFSEDESISKQNPDHDQKALALGSVIA